jgi:CubicO group peptidase (beta-lactamase class C family)
MKLCSHRVLYVAVTAIVATIQLCTWNERIAAEVPVVAPAELGLSAEHLARIDGIVAKEIEAKNLPGCVVAIGRTGGIGLLKAYGHRQVEPDEEPMTTDTVFDMASLTKPIATATSVMILVERGELRLRNPVADYIPEFGENGKDKITVEDLLVHRGGLVPDNSLGDSRTVPKSRGRVSSRSKPTSRESGSCTPMSASWCWANWCTG